MRKIVFRVYWLAVLVAALGFSTVAQTQTFTYQGSLKSGSAPANGIFDFQFDVYGSEFAGTPFATNTVNLVDVRNGIFTVTLSAPTGVFNGEARFLEIRVKPAGAENYELLTPRQLITSAPYAVRSLNAQTAVNATNAQNAQSAETAFASVTATFAANVTGTVGVANGGTGANNAAGARTNLGLGTLSTVTPTGAADNTKFLRGDNTWADAPIYFNATLSHSSTTTSTPGFYYPNGTVTRSVSPNGYESFFILPRACRLSDFKVTVIGYGSSFSIQRTFEINYTGSPLSVSPPNVALSITIANRSGAVESGSSSATFDVPALNFIRLTQRVTGLSSDNSTAYVSFTCR